MRGSAMVRAAIVVGMLPAVCAAHGQSAARKEISACQPLRDAHTTYVLTRDVEAAQSCFSIEADDITLDLNQHTVTYGAEARTERSYGVYAVDCWFAPAHGNSCGGSHKNIEVRNGTVLQGAGAAPSSHALNFGQAANLTGVKVHGLNITVHAEDSIAIYADYLPGGSEVYGNTIHNQVTVISSRSQFRGASIKLDEEAKATLPDNIHDNVIVGGAQIGIRSDNPAGTKIANNDIAQDATYTNGFCIDAAGDNMRVTGNHCHPRHGRGLHANHSHVVIADNVVDTADSDKNLEYKGCEINGTYGIQVESDDFAPDDVEVSGNHVTVHARECPAEAMRLTDLTKGTVRIHDNEFIALTEGRQPARAFSAGGVAGVELQFAHNTLKADSAIFHVDWDGASGLTMGDSTFTGAEDGKTLLAEIESGAVPSRQISFEDDTLRNVSGTAARFGESSKDSWYEITRRQPVRFAGAGTNAVASITDKSGTVYESAKRSGDIFTFVLPVLRVEHGVAPQHFAPYTLHLRDGGCSASRALPEAKMGDVAVGPSCPHPGSR